MFEIDNQTKEIYKTKLNYIKPFGLCIEDDLQQLNFSEQSTNNFIFSDIPFWQITKPKIDLSLTKFKKDKTPPNTFKEEYENLLKNYPSHETVFTDGSKNENSVGLAAIHHTKKIPLKSSKDYPQKHPLLSKDRSTR